MTHLFVCLLSLVMAQEAADTAADAAIVKGWLQVSRGHARQYVISPVDSPDTKLRRLEQPVFRHAQPARGNDIGAVYLWVDANNRPAVIGDIFSWSVNSPARNVTHELHSLADWPLDVQFNGKKFWKPKAAGLDWKPIPDSPVPAESKAARSRQMRELARRFSANSIDYQSRPSELRVLPQPVHQFDNSEPKTTQAGALFAICHGTDPELWLAIESRSTSDGARWHYACASFTDYGLQVRLDDKEVWRCDRFQFGASELPHFCQQMATGVRVPDKIDE